LICIKGQIFTHITTHGRATINAYIEVEYIVCSQSCHQILPTNSNHKQLSLLNCGGLWVLKLEMFNSLKWDSTKWARKCASIFCLIDNKDWLFSYSSMVNFWSCYFSIISFIGWQLAFASISTTHSLVLLNKSFHKKFTIQKLRKSSRSPFHLLSCFCSYMGLK